MRRIVRHSWIAFSLAAVMSVPAQAAPVVDVPSIAVPVAAADIATEPALKSLIARLRLAARNVCKEEYRNEVVYSHACRVGTFHDALAQLERLRARQLATLSAASIVIRAQ